MTADGDTWAAGRAYEPYIGRWSRLVAREFLAWLAAPAAARWIDVGCGTGALTATIAAQAAPQHACGIDGSVPYATFARDNLRDPRVAFLAADARRLPVRSASADAVVSALALNFIPQPDLAVAEMTRVARPGGTVALYVWDYAGEMQVIRQFWQAAAALDPGAAALDEGRRFPVCRPEALRALFTTAGLERVESRAIDVRARFRDFADYWTPFTGGQGPAPGYAMSLSEERRTRLRDRLRAQLPTARDGSIELLARAWAVRGTRG